MLILGAINLKISSTFIFGRLSTKLLSQNVTRSGCVPCYLLVHVQRTPQISLNINIGSTKVAHHILMKCQPRHMFQSARYGHMCFHLFCFVIFPSQIEYTFLQNSAYQNHSKNLLSHYHCLRIHWISTNHIYRLCSTVL